MRKFILVDGRVYKMKILSKPLFIILPAMSCFIFILYSSLLSSNYKQVEMDVSKYILQWKNEISDNIFYKKDKDLVRKISDGLRMFPLSRYEVVAIEKTIHRWSDKTLVESPCKSPIEDILTLNGLHLGKVKSCISDKSMIRMTLFSPTFIIAILVVVVLLFGVSFLPLFSYRKSLRSTIHLLKSWNNNSDSPLPSASGDKTTHEIIALVKQGFNLRMNLQEIRLELENQKEVARIMKHVAHDIRNPISNLNGLLSKGAEISKEEADIIMRSSIKSINETSRSLLNKDTINSYRLEMKRPIQVSVLAKEVMRDKKALYEKIEFKSKIQKEAKAICSPAEFKRVLANLITNSIEAIPLDKQGVIICTVVVDDSSCLVTITDNGKGISSKNLDKVFNENFTSGKTFGNGLGLHYVDQKTREWGGAIKICSEVNEGTTISLILKSPKEESNKFRVMGAV